MYDFLYTIGDQLIKTYNPCQIQKDADGEVNCLEERLREERLRDRTDKTLCCTTCKFLGPSGCTTRCLGCKLGLCSVAQEANLELYKILHKMLRVAYKYDMGIIRTSKEEVFKYLKVVKESQRKMEELLHEKI